MTVLKSSFARDMVERALKTVCQVALALLIADPALGILDVSWLDVLNVSLLAGVVSVLTSVTSAPFGTPGTASLTRNP